MWFVAVAVGYFLIVNVVAFAAYGVDKRRARLGQWRIRESWLLALAVLGGALGAFLAMRIFRHKTSKRRFTWVVTPLMVVQTLAFAVVVALGAQLANSYQPTERALSALSSDDEVSVRVGGADYVFDGPGTQSVLAFYPGAFVETSSYAPLMRTVAESGVDCVLLDMPLDLGLLGANRAESVCGKGGYERYYVGGHSMGGVAACMYAQAHSQELSGLVLLGSYSSVDLSGESLATLLAYGSNDEVLDRDNYEKARALLPQGAVELVIEGGNHAQFGDYGAQAGDGEAIISTEEQQRMTADAICELCAAGL